MTLEEFVRMTGVKEKTVKSRLYDIPGTKVLAGGHLDIPSGSRYPDRKRKCDTDEKCCYAILQALNKNHYLEETFVGMTSEVFNRCLKLLEDADWIKRNQSGNEYGTNPYDITCMGIKELQESRESFLRKIEAVIKAVGGVSSAISTFMV